MKRGPRWPVSQCVGTKVRLKVELSTDRLHLTSRKGARGAAAGVCQFVSSRGLLPIPATTHTVVIFGLFHTLRPALRATSNLYVLIQGLFAAKQNAHRLCDSFPTHNKRPQALSKCFHERQRAGSSEAQHAAQILQVSTR